jgi:hypothetical protein
VRARLDWKYLLGLSLEDPGFDYTVLVAGAGLEQVALDALLARLAADGLVKAGGKQRADSTHVVAFSELRNDHGVRGGGHLPEVCRTAVITRLVLRSSRPVRASRRLTGMPSARLAARRRIRPSLPSLNYR